MKDSGAINNIEMLPTSGSESWQLSGQCPSQLPSSINGLKNNDLSKNEQWLTIPESRQLLELPSRTIRHRCRKGKYVTKWQNGRGGKRYLIALSSLPADVRIKYFERYESNLPVEIKRPKIGKILTERQREVALARASLVNLYIKYYDGKKGKLKLQNDFIEGYNYDALPNIKKVLGEVNKQTLNRWRKTFLDSGKDFYALAPQYKVAKPKSVHPEQAEILIKNALNPNQPLISEVVRKAIKVFTVKGDPHLLHDGTYRRFLIDWKNKHFDIWTYYREGKKALNDKVLPFVERNYDLLEVGDVLVADGHILNFEVINPYTGKPKRMMMILFYDMKSSMPLGWEISPTENIQSIAVALFRAILRLGKKPKAIYIDNGRAFGAKYFNYMPM